MAPVGQSEKEQQELENGRDKEGMIIQHLVNHYQDFGFYPEMESCWKVLAEKLHGLVYFLIKKQTIQQLC